MNIKITSDSTCDLSSEIIAENNITIVPLNVIKNGKLFKDGEDIVSADIFAHVDSGGELCSTSAVNAEEYRSVFEPLAKQYDAVIHISLGSDFSSCFQNAALAAAELDNVYVVDSKNLSTGQGHVVIEACRRAENCSDANTLKVELDEFASRVEASFILNRLDYMVKGGRCSMVAALGANLLKLKPCIEVKDGKMQVVKKYRGSYSKCLAEYVKDRLDARPDIIRDKLFLTYTPVDSQDIDVVKDCIKQYGNFSTVYETKAGCTVSCHCGPGTLGVLFVRNK